MNNVADGQTVFFYYLDRSGTPDTARDFGGQPACDASLGGGNQAQMPLWTSACLQGRCLLFDGADDFVVTNCQDQPPDSFTLGLSFFPRTYFLEPGPSSASVQQVGDSVIWPLVSGSHLQVLLHPANRTIIVERQGFSNCSTDRVVALNAWNRVLVTYDVFLQQIQVYLNGRLVRTCRADGPLLTLPASVLRFGRDLTPVPGHEAFAGMMDDIELWDEVLPVGGPFFEFNFEHAATTDATVWDDSGNNNDAHIEGKKQFRLEDTTLYGRAMSFDGATYLVVSDSLQDGSDCPSFASHPEVLDVDKHWRDSGGLTMEAWVLFRTVPAPGQKETFVHRAAGNRQDDYWWFGVEEGVLSAHLGGPSGVIDADFWPEKDRWYHLAAVFTRSHAWLYINGRVVADRPVEPTVLPTDQQACIGARCLDEGDGSMQAWDFLDDALLDNVKVGKGAWPRFDVFEARYDFEDLSAGLVPDRSANQHPLDLHGNADLTTVQDGWDNEALELVGGYGVIRNLSDALRGATMGTSGPGELGPGLSVDAWVLYDDAMQEGESQTIFSMTRTKHVPFYSGWGWWRRVILLPFLTEEAWFGLRGISNSGAVALTFEYRGVLVSKRVPFPPGTWHHVGACWDGSSLHLFLDGRQVAAMHGVQPDAMLSDLDFGEGLIGARRVGLSWTAQPIDLLRGRIDEFRLSRFPKDFSEDSDGDRMDDSHEIIRSTVRTSDYPQGAPNRVNRRVAMVVNGGEESCFENAARVSVYLLRAFGYHEQDVTVYGPLSPDRNPDDVDRCPVDVDYWEAEPTSLWPHEDIVAQLSSFSPAGPRALSDRDILFFNFVDHGHLTSYDSSTKQAIGYYQLLDSYGLNDVELGNSLSNIETYRTVLIIASCYAAVAMDEVGPQSNVVFLAATAPEQVNNWPWLETIQNGLFGVGDRDGDGMVSYEEAFSYAWDVAVQFGQEEVECDPPTNPHSDTCPEKAQIGDNADQWGHSPDDPTADYDPNQPGVDGFRARRCWP